MSGMRIGGRRLRRGHRLAFGFHFLAAVAGHIVAFMPVMAGLSGLIGVLAMHIGRCSTWAKAGVAIIIVIAASINFIAKSPKEGG